MRVIEKIKNLISWFPVIWNDFDWDYQSIYRILEHKLSRMENVIRGGYAVDAEATADKIKFCSLLCKRLAECDYLERALIPHKRKWGSIGDLITKELPGGKRKWGSIGDLITKELPGGMSEWLGPKWEKADTEEKRLQAEEEFRRAAIRADWRQEQDKNELFDAMKKYITGWWD